MEESFENLLNSQTSFINSSDLGNLQNFEPIDPLNFSLFENIQIGDGGLGDEISTENDETATKNTEDEEEDENDDDNVADYWTRAVQKVSAKISDVFKDAPQHTDWEEDEDEMLKDRMEVEQELEMRKRKRKRKDGKKGRIKGYQKTVLSPIAQHDLGQANSAFLDGDYDRATEICQRIVKEFPHAAEPYQTLAMVYEETGDTEKCLLFYMVSAHLRPGEVNLWTRNAELSKENNMPEQAAYCLKKAIKAAPETPELYEDLAELQLDLGKLGRAIRTLLRLFSQLRPTDIELAQDIAKLFVEMEDPDKAVAVYRACLRNRGVSDDDIPRLSLDTINILAELYLLNRNFGEAYEILICVSNSNPKLPIDLKIKLAVCCIHLNRLPEASTHFQCLSDISIKDAPDLFHDIAVAYYETGNYIDAINLFRLILNDEALGDQYQEPCCWLRLAECFERIGEIDNATEYFMKVLSEHPSAIVVRFALADMLEMNGRNEDASKVRSVSFEDYYGAEELEKSKEFNIFLKKFTDIRNETRREYFKFCMETYRGMENEDLSSQNILIQSQIIEYQLNVLISTFNHLPRFFRPKRPVDYQPRRKDRKKRKSLLKVPDLPADVTSASEAESDADKSEFDSDVNDEYKEKEEITLAGNTEVVLGLSIAEWFEVNLVYARLSIKKANLLSQVSFSSSENENGENEECKMADFNIKLIEQLKKNAFLQMNRVCKIKIFRYSKEYKNVTRFVLLGLAMLAGEHDVSWELFRWLHQRHMSHPWITMIFMILYTNTDKQASEVAMNTTSQKYFTRYLKYTNGKDPFLMTILGQMLIMRRNFLPSVQFLGRAFHFVPNDPLLPLLLSTAMVQRSSQRRTKNRHLDVTQALAFLQKYTSLRKDDDDTPWKIQETHYNSGRIYSHLGLYTFAVYEYEKVLKLSEMGNIPAVYDLKREAAHNLSLVHMLCGAETQARYIKEKYLKI